MGPPGMIATMLTAGLLSLYRVTLNLPDVPFSSSLRRPNQLEYRETADRVREAAFETFKNDLNFHNVTVLQFRYEAVVGTMVIFDLTFLHPTSKVKERLEDAIRNGRLGGSLTVGPDGFEIVEHQANASRPTQLCADGSIPEFSLHGSTYCWEHAVCPTGTSCIDNQCCRSGQNQKRSVVHGCSEGEFHCHSGECIPSNYECNRRYDCQDGTDELHCAYFNQRREHSTNAPESRHDTAQCNDQQVRCRDSVELFCIHYEKLCDRVSDCPQGWDEQNCAVDLPPTTQTSPTTQQTNCPYRCANGQCISSDLMCNRRYDCQDGSDELNCDYFKQAHRITTAPQLEAQYRRQQEEERRRIHAEHQRRQQEAEQERLRLESIQTNQIGEPQVVQIHEGCQPSEFTCNTGECLDRRRVCDRRRDCTDGSDEYDCSDDSADDLQITVYPHEVTTREGQDATFECRARGSDGQVYPQVRWTRVGGPMPTTVRESGSTLSFFPVSVHDSGRYACVATHSGRSVEAYATLHVHRVGPQEQKVTQASASGCMADERSCGSNECVKAEYICDGERDCSDGSDEENCPNKRHCEPNEFRCNNDRCVQKMWLCDGDDDCGDRSDEQNCGERKPGDLCQPTEFQCADKRQCVPQSFQCDGTNDCRDGSDEVGCVQPTVVQPPDSNREVRQGDQFQLTCRAVAVPEPYINWRLNWGPVCEPPRCVQHSEGGVGTLTVNNAQPVDSGAYSCEAINTKGRVLATPDCIVRIVNIPAPTPPPAPPQLSCRSGEYNSPRESKGCLSCFCFGVTDQCQSSNWYRTKDKLVFNGHSDGVTLTDIEQRPQSEQFNYGNYGFLTNTETTEGSTRYWKLPQRFLGDKISAYGGELSVQLQYSGQGRVSQEPLIVLKGNGITLVHRAREHQFQPDRPVHIRFETYENNFEHLSGQPAQRSDLMMVLADLDAFLIRATHTDDQTSTSLGDVNWQIAVERDTQEGYALEVEQCICPPGYTGLSCEDCAPGYERAPGPYLGICVPRRAPQISCGPGGHAQDNRCVCKPNVVGPQCDRCAPNTFNLSPRNPQGCSRCWCAGVTPTCDSSSYRRSRVEVDYGRGAQDQIEISTDDVRQPYRPQSQPQVTSDSIRFDGFQEARGQTLYWKLPIKFGGDKVTSYGGNLNYVARCSGDGQPNRSPDVVIRGNNVILHHNSRQQQQTDRDNSVSIPITEQSFTRADGQQASREDLLMALADVDEVLVKSTCVDDTRESSLVSVSMDYAEPYGSGELALDVEQCRCPEGYVGPSCEDCAPGYSRVQGGPYLGLCQKCDCNGHASQCDSQYGTCVDCQHNTEGDHCERCLPGFVGDARRGTPNDCQPAQTKPPCQCYNHSPRGCDSFGRCLLCEHSTEGYHCEACKKGYYGDATRGTPYDCTPCPCPGASECFMDQNGQVNCRNCPAGYAGRLCDECAPGYSKSANTDGRDCEPTGRVYPDHKEFVPPNEGRLVVQILPPKNLGINEGSRAKWVCHVTGEKPENVDLTWTKIGEQELPSHIQQHGNQLVIDSVRASDQGYYRCTGTSKTGAIASDEAQLTITQPRTAPFYQPPQQTPIPKPVVTPPHQVVDTHQSATFTCLVPGFADCEVAWHFNELNGPLPPGVHRRGNQLYIPQAEQHHEGNYICSVVFNKGDQQVGQAVSNPGRLEVNKPEMRPIADPPLQEVGHGDPARFRCWVPNHPNAEFKWRTESGGPLPHGVVAQDGILHIHSAEQSHAQRYICSATDPQRPERGPVDANPVELRLRHQPAPSAPQVDPVHQTVTKGRPARIRCWVPGQPDAQLKWSGAHDRNGVLEFPSVEAAHANSYICSVYDPQTGQPIDSPEAQLEVRDPVKPLVNPPEQVVKKGDPATPIRCHVPGEPNAQLRWHRRGGQPLPPGARDDGRGNLHIESTDLVHQGDYECTYYDPNDRQPSVSDPASITVNEPVELQQGTPPRPVATPPVITVRRGEPARFHCEPNSDSPADVHWGFGAENGPLRGDAIQEGDDVVIESADETTAGEYLCVATNAYGTGQAQPVRLVLTDQEIPPAVRVEPKVFNGRPGDTHQFKCVILAGTPTPQITWSGPNGGALPADVVDLGEGVLEITNAKKSVHDGDYECRAVNIVGEASDKGSVNIEGSIKLITTPHGPKIIVAVGEPLEIKCEAFGEPDPEVEWLHDPGPERGDLPDDYVPVTISEQFIRHPSVGLGNAGIYTCRVQYKTILVLFISLQLTKTNYIWHYTSN
ncbi:Basement membrane proteoglycan [Aphelenchoides besseyi]|nr:Basement membrane proteoglycan [Aphelenchoides besseyi]